MGGLLYISPGTIKFLKEKEFNYPNFYEAMKAFFTISDLSRYNS